MHREQEHDKMARCINEAINSVCNETYAISDIAPFSISKKKNSKKLRSLKELVGEPLRRAQRTYSSKKGTKNTKKLLPIYIQK